MGVVKDQKWQKPKKESYSESPEFSPVLALFNFQGEVHREARGNKEREKREDRDREKRGRDIRELR